MRKTLLSLLTLTLVSSSIFADVPAEPIVAAPQQVAPAEGDQATPTTPEGSTQAATSPDANSEDKAEELPESKYVGKASEDGVRSTKSQQWQNVALAVAAVAVATTALLLVSSHKGHRSN